ncbi:unnamed protein product [Moneuplotes crassus]|uniref:PH domain-containing protein n=1 Tax=Euplotes crassus TaxID=5936 RepID=A0AAD1UK60_EUPCR|nr:unnamed protein product [Moneuplotes crassus]
MEQKESCETQLYSEFNCLSYGSPNRAKNFRKKTVDVEEFHSLLSFDPDKDGELVKDKDYFDNRIDSCSNEEQYNRSSFSDEQNLGIFSKQMLENTKLVKQLGGYADLINSQSKIVSSNRGLRKNDEMRGYLHKRSANFFKGWQKRYVVLSYNRICYYKNEHDPHPVGIINLSMVDATVEISRKQKLKFSVLITGLKRKFRFKARTQEERNQWCSALIRSIENSDSCEKDSSFLNESRFWKKCDRINESTFLNEADSGDIILFTGKTVMSGITRKITNSNYDHVAMVLTFLEDNEVYLLESTASGVHITTWTDLKTYKDELYSKIVWRKLYCNRNETFCEVLGNFVNAVDDRGYDISIGRLLRRRSRMPTPSEILDEERIVDKSRNFFCSELVAKAYKTLGLLISSKSCTKIYPKHFSSKKSLKLTKSALGEELCVTF